MHAPAPSVNARKAPPRVAAALAFLLLSIACGCGDTKAVVAPTFSLEPTVTVSKPLPRRITRTISQPGVIEPYEQTAVYTQVAGYVVKWIADVGDTVKKGDVLAEVRVPELVEEVALKQALADQAKAGVEQARKLVLVADQNVLVAGGDIEEAKSSVKKYQADVERWQSEVARLTKLAQDKVVDNEVLEETRKQLKSSFAARDVANDTVKTKQIQKLAAAAQAEKARADTATAETQVAVAEAGVARIKALLAYTQVKAPYDAVITARNVNTGDTVRPATGDPTDGRTAEGQSADRAVPLYVLHRADKLMFVIGVPEVDAEYVKKGTPAEIRVQALGDEEFAASVSRIALLLNARSRTSQAQIDLPNPNNRFVPGMFANGRLLVERDNVRCLPTAAVFESGNTPCCYVVENGKVVRTPIQTGLSDGTWVEVRRKQTAGPDGRRTWVNITGDEDVAVGDLTELADGVSVKVKPGK